MTTACESTRIHAEACSDIFTAIEKAKTRAFSCVIADWADQPEASFLLKRARESVANQGTVAVVVVDHEPTAAEMRDHRLDFLIYRPISAQEADAVLTKACERMQPSSVEAAAESLQADLSRGGASASSGDSAGAERDHQEPSDSFSEMSAPEGEDGSEVGANDLEGQSGEEQEHQRGHAIHLNTVTAAVLVMVAMFFLWRSRGAIEYLSRTPEGRVRVLRESVAALFYLNQTGALPVSSAGGDAQQDAYFSRNPAPSDAQAPAIGVVATESNLPEAHMPLHKAPDLPLPVPVLERHDAPPIQVERVAIPESMKSSPPIAPPVVVTVNPAQMMPVSSPVPAPAAQQFSEPVSVTEDAARALLVHAVDPVYPAAGMAQKLHGAVVLQTVIGRDGSVEDVKIVRGYFILGRAAIAAVKQWRFQPYTINGHAASTQTTLTINFSYPG